MWAWKPQDGENGRSPVRVCPRTLAGWDNELFSLEKANIRKTRSLERKKRKKGKETCFYLHFDKHSMLALKAGKISGIYLGSWFKLDKTGTLWHVGHHNGDALQNDSENDSCIYLSHWMKTLRAKYPSIFLIMKSVSFMYSIRHDKDQELLFSSTLLVFAIVNARNFSLKHVAMMNFLRLPILFSLLIKLVARLNRRTMPNGAFDSPFMALIPSPVRAHTLVAAPSKNKTNYHGS